MSTEARDLANQANAQSSTGPRTEEGKAISSRNALKHGLTALTVLLPSEDPAEYDALSTGMLQDLAPFNTTETALVQELIDLQWRLRRASRYEARILSVETPDWKALHNMSLHAARIKRQFSATLKEFQQMHTANRDQRQLEEAEALDQPDEILQGSSNPAGDGFVLASDLLEHWIAVDQAIANAQKARQYGEDTDLENVA